MNRAASSTDSLLRDRLGLRIEEAAEAIGLSTRAFREHILPGCPKLFAGKAIIIPTRLFEQHLELLASVSEN